MHQFWIEYNCPIGDIDKIHKKLEKYKTNSSKNIYGLSKKIKNLKKILNTIVLRCILENIPEYVIKKCFQIVLLMSKLFLSSGYKSLKM
jgi:hypothetical protein